MSDYWHSGKWRLSDGGSWQDHLDRGSPGGEDFPLPHGTKVYAPDDGILSFHRAAERPNRIHGPRGWDGGGQVLLLTRADGVEFVLFHASAGEGLTLGGPGRRVVARELAGRSGGAKGTPSEGRSSGAHEHAHAVVNGRRVPISHVGGGSSAGTGAPTASNRSTGVPMFTLFANNDDSAWYAQGITGRTRKLSTEEFEQMSRLQMWMLGRVTDPNDNSIGIRRNAGNIAIQARVLADINGTAGVVIPSADEIAAATEARLRDEHDELLAAIAKATVGDGTETDDLAAVLLERLDGLPARFRAELGTALLAKLPTS